MKVLKRYIISIPIIAIIGGFVWTLIKRSNLKNIKERTKDWYEQSEISYPKNYKALVTKDKEENKLFILGDAVYCEIYDNRFPYFRKKVDLKRTRKLLKLLNDTSSYRWGEFGTPDYEKTIIYYGKTTEPIGYTLIDPMGEVENYPYRSLMKWGMLTDKGFNNIMKILNSK